MPGWNNTCQPIQQVFPDIVDLPSVQGLLGGIYATLFLLGLVGNSLVLYAVTCALIDFNVRHIFVGSLAFADLLLALLTLPFSAVQTFERNWSFGSVGCVAIPFLQSTSTFATTFTLVAIAYDRQRLARYPQQAVICQGNAWRLVLTAWLAAIVLAIPYASFMQLESNMIFGTRKSRVLLCGQFCTEVWPSMAWKATYGGFVFVVQLILPATACSYCYLVVNRSVKQRLQNRLKTENMSLRTLERLRERQRFTSRMVALMVMSFILPWLPLNVFNLFRDMVELQRTRAWFISEQYFATVFTLCHCLAMSSVIWYPLIYCFCNPELRQIMRQRYVHFDSRERSRLLPPHRWCYKTNQVLATTTTATSLLSDPSKLSTYSRCASYGSGRERPTFLAIGTGDDSAKKLRTASDEVYL